ncbi:MAG TPA: TonB-dependent receptor [Thermoanaerobaculia bacterium]
MRQILLAAGILGGAMPALLAQPIPSTPSAQGSTAATGSAATGAAASGAAPRFSDSLVVTPSLDAEPRDDTPATVTVIDAREIEDRQARDLADLLWSVPGVTVSQAGAPGQQTSVFTRGANSSQTLLLWNGIPLNDPFFGDVNWQFVPTEGVERVEVVRGPFSALYGSNAVGGVVQVLTGTRHGLAADLEGGEHGYARGALAGGTSLGGVQLDLTGNARRSDGTLNDDFFDGEEVVARALWAALPGTSLGVLARANDAKTGVPFSSGVPTPETRISWREREIALPVDATGGRWLVDAQLSDTRFDDAFRSPDDPFGAYASDTRSETLAGRAVGSYHLLQQAAQDLELSLGTEGQSFRVSSQDVFGTNLDRAHQRTWAGFGQASYGGGPVRLDVGVRRDDNDVYGGQTSLRAGGAWRIAGGTRVRASYGQAFRAPTLGELYFPFSGNPDLRPETGTSYELGLEQDAGPWRFMLTGFENRQRNLIVFDNFSSQDVNVGRARSRGLEGLAGFRRGIFSAQLNGTRLDAVDLTTGLELLRRPRWSANLLATARPGPWTFSFTGRYVGERADLDPVITTVRRTNPGFVRLDLAASRRALSWLSPYARIENLADRRYSEVLGYPSPGRTLIGGVTVNL